MGEELPVCARVVMREDVRAYANAGGDQNPLHQNDEVAKRAGFDGIIAHGMFTMGHLGACVAGWAGDPVRITRLSAQFRAPVFIGETIAAGGRVKRLDIATRSATVELWVTVERGGVLDHPIRRGEAEIGFPP